MQSKIATANKTLEQSEALFSSLVSKTVRLSDIVDEVRDGEKIDPEKIYDLLGVRWWGEGAFIREQKRGREIKASTVYRMTKGHIIYNRLFAFRGSFAIVSEEQDGCYVSGEFPTFVSKPDIEHGSELCRYIVHCLNSPEFLKIIDAQSTGSTKTSRNRFNQSLFNNLIISQPVSQDDLLSVVKLLDTADVIRTEQQKLSLLGKTLREGIFGMLPLPAKAESMPPAEDAGPPSKKAKVKKPKRGSHKS